MEIYIPNQEKLNKLQNKTILLTIFPLLFLVCIVISLYMIFNNLSRFYILIISLAVLLDIVIVGIRIYRIKKDWSSFIIKLSDVSIIKNQNKKTQIKICFDEITRVTRVSDGTLIETLNPKKFIYIPNIIERYDEFLNKINLIKLIDVTTKRISPEYAFDSRLKYRTLKDILIYVGIGLFIGVLIIICTIGWVYYF